MRTVVKGIEQSLLVVLEHDTFQQWYRSLTVGAGDVIAFNNSFVFRDVKTVKSELYLATEVDDKGLPQGGLFIVQGLRFNTDFKRIPKRGSGDLVRKDLDEAVSRQLDRLGTLIFMLIGGVDDSVVIEQPINHSGFESVKWDPSIGDRAVVSGDAIIVGETHDEDELWNTIALHYQSEGQQPPDGLKEAFGVALDKLQDRAVANLQMPDPAAPASSGITDAILEVLKKQRTQYSDALDKLPDNAALNEVLRIAYNFASDAVGYLRLIVSICDLKPVVLWGTIGNHFGLSESFRQLPWTRSRNKPSLKNYEATISDARNSAFHNLFPFRKSLNVQLPDAALKDATLRIFSEHAKKKENQLSYEDKGFVDVLVEFTRARERRVTDRFWRQNLDVMDGTIRLFSSTNSFIRLLHSMRGSSG